MQPVKTVARTGVKMSHNDLCYRS